MPATEGQRRRDWPQAVIVAARLVSFAILCAVLYFGQVVLIPIALAALIAFVLSPPVLWLQRVHVPRMAAVLIVFGLVTAVLAGVGWVVVGELRLLAEELPSYRQNIREKIADVRELTRGGAIDKVQDTIEDISKDIEQQAEPSAPEPGETQPVPVAVQAEGTLLGGLGQVMPVMEAAASGGLALLLAIFILLKREDVRNRIVSVAGQAALVTTTKAFAEAGSRISRYLLMQLVINATMGLAVGIGTYLIGVPYAALWGLAAAVLRYIPYVGPWIAASLPIAVTIVTSPEWQQVLLVIGLFVGLELVSNNVMEPWLYGQSVGLSPIAVIVAVIFWTFIWGAAGLVLATPLTVCLVVAGKYVSGLGVFDRLLGEGRALEPHLWLYQRLLARDEGEAAEVLEEYAEEHSREDTCDELLMRTLLAVKRDRVRGHVSDSEAEFVATALEEIVDDLVDDSRPEPKDGVVLVGFPPEDRLDEVALRLLDVLLAERKVALEILSSERLIGERIAALEAEAPVAVCIPSLGPGELAATRLVCKRLHSRLPGLPLLVGRFHPASGRERGRHVLQEAGAALVVDTLAELRDAALARVRSAQAALPADSAPPAATPESAAV